MAGGDNHVDTSSEDDVDAPIVLRRGVNPIVAKDWAQEIKELLGMLECTEEQKVRFATFKLVREAKRWWRSAKMVEEQCLGYASITRSLYREVFFRRYFPIATREAKVVELSRFAPHMGPDEPKKAWIFERGLRQGVRSQVALLLTQSFSGPVNKAMAVETSIQEGEKVENQKKRPLP
ncbi:uncharacterized protein LOC131153772 [Malania oleifera]|uniref:uncharacterized protein LOC131153772 n=1 Tax=Malania oleifera TaxID=397392 RepID=UPI0025AE4340|nr:uncharacterized protein LOC131153772 [Malania oleifera]